MRKREKKPERKPGKGAVRRLLGYTGPYGWFLVLALVLAAVNIFCTLLAPVVVGEAIDFIIGPGNVNMARVLEKLVTLGVIVGVGALCAYLMSLTTNKVTHNTVRDLRTAVFSKLARIPLSYTDTTPHGDTVNRMISDIELVSDGLIQGFAQIFTGVVTILGTLAFMLSINWGIALLVVLLTPLSLVVASFIASRIHRYFRRQSELQGEIGGFSEEYFAGAATVRAMGGEEEFNQRFTALNEKLYPWGLGAQFYAALTNPCTRFVNSVVYAAVGIAGAAAVISGALTIGQASCFLTYANQYTKPFNEVTGVLAQLQTAAASAARVFQFLDQMEEPDDSGAKPASSATGRVELKNVWFSYSKDREFIKDLSLTVNPGEKVAIVGPTGCGKTTIINLLMRFYDVDKGAILVDGQDIRELKRDSLRRQYAMVLQETWLTQGTVHENIAYGKPSATREEVVAAAKKAHAHSFIVRMPHGYDTVLGREDNLSSGQLQLLCIARVMLADPPILILDEATSSIDTLTERKIQHDFDLLTAGKTSFVVAHRLSTIQNANVILVMRDGAVVEKGDHKSLLEKGGFYAQLYNSQFDVRD